MSSADETASPMPADPAVRAGLIRRFITPQLIRFGVTGIISFSIDLGVLRVLHGGFGVWLPLATYCGILGGFIANFLLNREWVFVARAGLGGQAVRYIALAVGNWVITVSAVWALASAGVPYLIARTVMLVILSLVNFFVYKMWVFRPAH